MRSLKQKEEVGYVYFGVEPYQGDFILSVDDKDINKIYDDVLLETLEEFGWETDFSELGRNTFVWLKSEDAINNMFRNISSHLLHTHRVDMRFEHITTSEGKRYVKVRLSFLDLA
jgi:hypothetical protein